MNFVGKQDTIQHFVTVIVARIRTSVQETTKKKIKMPTKKQDNKGKITKPKGDLHSVPHYRCGECFNAIVI